MELNKSSLISGFGWLISMFLLPITLLIAFASKEGHLATGRNSDLVQSYLQIRDLMANPLSIADWHLPPALSIFPDWLLAALPTMLFPADPAYALAIYPALLLSLYCLAGGRLLSPVHRASPLELTWILAGVMVISSWSTYQSWSNAISSWLFTTSAHPNIHTGAVLMTLFCSWLLLQEIQTSGNTSQRYLLMTTVWLTTFSDAIFFVWFVVPAIGLLAIHAWTKRQWAPVRTASALAISSLSAVVLDRLIRFALWPLKVPLWPMKLVSPFHSLTLFSQDIIHTIAAGDRVFCVMIVVVIAILIRGGLAVYRLFNRHPADLKTYFEVLIATSILAALGVVVPTGIYSETALWRYLLIIPALAVIWVMHWLLRFTSSPRTRLGWFAGTLATIMVGTSATSSRALTNIGTLAQPPTLEICLRARGRTTGFGDYWTAKELMFSSNRRIHILQLTPSGEPFRWVYNETWYQARADNGTAVRPDFVILSGLETTAIQRRFGMPDERLLCAGTEIWLYDRPIPWSPG